MIHFPTLDSQVFLEAQPFPHVVVDDLIPLKWVRRINAEWPASEDNWKRHEHKHSAKRACPYPNAYGPSTRELFLELNTDPFLERLKKLSGIEGLCADAELAGGGLHETFPGGFLDVHADFNLHPETRLHRRLNLLLYLNEDWRPEWAGHLQLCGGQGKICIRAIAPLAGRAVIFATTDSSFHGHPNPLACPYGISRRSIALYYYSAERPESEISREHSTLYLGDEDSWPKAA
jgi:Rps23 Pro-64 3,4-dihydroxylase Tpa1-like proline 4-hydroxylase